MTIIVTGGAGFIGSNFIFFLLNRYHSIHVICLDNLTYAGNIENLTRFRQDPRFRFVQGNICDRTIVTNLFSQEKPDYVVNFAAESHVDRSITEPEIFLQTNIIGTSVLMDACCKFEVQRFHQVSTDEVYGELPFDMPELLFTETSPLRPSSPYSSSKASADLLALAYHRTYGLDVTISRSSNNYGPYQFPEKLIPLVISKAVTDQFLPVYGSGQNIRDWIYVEDHCAAIDLLLHSGTSGQVYNVGSNDEIRNIDLVRTICNELGKPESLIQHVPDRRGHDLRYSINSQKIRLELGWTPRISIDTGLKQTISWYLQNRSWWKDLR